MKNFSILLLMAVLLMFVTSCGDSKVINVPVKVDKTVPGAKLSADSVSYFVMKDVEFETYGFMNKGEYHNDMIEYDWTGGNLFWSVVLSETIVVPALIIGLDWYEPVGLKSKYNESNVVILEE